jgi:heavy metal sensor kinase
MKALGLRARLTLFYTLMLAAMLSLFGVLFYHSLNLVVDRSLTEQLRQRVVFLRNYMRVQDGNVQLIVNPNDREEAYLIHNAARYYQVFRLPSGELLVQSQELDLLGVRLTPDEARALARSHEYSELQVEQERLRFDNSVIAGGNSPAFLVRVGIPMTPADNVRKEFLRSLLFLAPLGVFAAAVMGWEMARRALRPMKQLADAARNIDIEQLQQRLPFRGAGDEVDELAQSFNETLSRLENSVGQMKQFTASISHELRTPLTILRGEAEVALLEAHSIEDYRHLLSSQLEEFDKLTRMINDLLVLAHAEAGEIRWAEQVVDLSVLAASLAEQLEPVAASKQIELKTEIVPNVHVRGDASWLERVVLNLLDNAIKFTLHRGQVLLSVSSKDARAELRVQDKGMGITPDALPHVFERFYRAEPSRSKRIPGVGLGLALARWIVEKHRGRITVQSQPGEGASFTVTLPLDRANSNADFRKP